MGSLGLPYKDQYKSIYEKYYAKRKVLTDMENITLGSGAVLAGFLTNKNLYHCTAIYEEMMSNIETNVKIMFQALNIPQNNIDICIKALDRHSQNKMFDVNKTFDLITEKDWTRADEILAELNLPFRISMSIEDFIKLVK